MYEFLPVQVHLASGRRGSFGIVGKLGQALTYWMLTYWMFQLL